ncbi:MAG: glycosyltransferase [Bacteroidetes bacterium]|nr:glycosyltransferase [Bacteroidota bacterium]MBU1720182.1 glycosyltransferase [Bacteroidota bacterium]
MKPKFSVILPVYMQALHSEFLINSYTQGLEKLEGNWELIFVVNGQDDGMADKLLALSRDDERVRIERLEAGGWGLAVKHGINVAKGDFICYTNSARTDVSDLVMILQYAAVNKNNVVKANRVFRELWLRKLGSVLYNFENRILFRTPVWDVNGTPKAFPADIIRLFPIVSDNDLIDAEIIARCNALKIPIIEIPVRVTNRISGKSTTNIRSGLKMYFGLFSLKKKLTQDERSKQKI